MYPYLWGKFSSPPTKVAAPGHGKICGSPSNRFRSVVAFTKLLLSVVTAADGFASASCSGVLIKTYSCVCSARYTEKTLADSTYKLR